MPKSEIIHKEAHPKAGKTVKIKPDVIHPQVATFGGSDFRLEDWWDRVSGGSWMWAEGNPACLIYAMRNGFNQLPADDEVVYGKIAGLGHLVHVSELADA